MKKFWIVFTCLLTAVLIGGTVIAVAADENPVVKAGESYAGDFIKFGVTVSNEGTILGDFIAGAQTLTNTGEVEGDLIGFATQVIVDGRVGGSLRAGGADVRINTEVERNAMVLGTNVTVGDNTVVKRNAYFLGTSVSTTGKVMGNTVIYAQNITLGGIYEGDVRINDMTEGTSLNILPGTVIKGELTYEGVTRYEVPSDVEVGSYSYIKMEPTNKNSVKPAFSLWDFVKKIFTLLVYYLFALLIYKAFPRFFVRSGDFIEARFLSSAGIGIAAMGSLVAGILALILLLILALFIIKGSVVLLGSLAILFVTVITVVFADIPVSMWLGNIITKRKPGVPARLAAGFALISAVKLALGFLKNLEMSSSAAGIILFIINLSIWILGTGALMKTVIEISKSANKQAEAEEFSADASENTGI